MKIELYGYDQNELGTKVHGVYQNPRVQNWIRVTGETEFDGCEFRVWLRWAMREAHQAGVGGVVSLDDGRSIKIWNHAEFDRFLDGLPVDFGEQWRAYPAKLEAYYQRLREKDASRGGEI